MAECTSCRQEVRWVIMARTGRRMPIDPEPDRERGNMILVRSGENAGKAIVLGGPLLDRAREDRDTRLYVSHFATCPFAKEHRRG